MLAEQPIVEVLDTRGKAVCGIRIPRGGVSRGAARTPGRRPRWAVRGYTERVRKFRHWKAPQPSGLTAVFPACVFASRKNRALGYHALAGQLLRRRYRKSPGTPA